jgi:DNA-binding SARP family transcriptional activator
MTDSDSLLAAMVQPSVEPRVSILGTVEVSGGGRTTSLPGVNLPALLSMLALTPGRPVLNERLIDALWPDADPARGRRSLISLVHQLNTALSVHMGLTRAVVSVKSVGRALRVDPAVIDAVQFERRLAVGDDHAAAGRLGDAVDAYEAALSLWRGEPFGGVDLQCFVEPSARLRVARQRAETALIEASLGIGRGAELVPWLQQRVDADPVDERAASDAARALYQAGRSGDALRVLRRCLDELRRRGIEPHPATARLELDVLDHTLDEAGGSMRAWHARPLAANATADLARRRAPNSARQVTRTARASDLIGRQRERARIDGWFGASANPAPGWSPGPTVLLISGQPGIGKTALLDGWLRDVDDDLNVVRAHCSPEQILPFEPFASLFPHVATTAEGDDAMAAERLFPTARHLLFDDVVRRIVDERSPVDVLAIDDAHWMTVASVALLRHVLWHPDVTSLRVVLTARTPDLAANAAVTQLLTDVVRAGWSCTVPLEPFATPELRELAARHGVGVGAPVDIDRLEQLTGGNPLFAIQVLHSGHDLDATWVPATVESLLGRYLEPLDPTSRRIVEMAALVGADGSPSRLAACTGTTELDVMDALDLVGDGRLVHVEPIGGAYRFVHDLARRTVVAGISPARAAQMHVVIAEALQREARPDAFAVAHHLSVGRDAAAPDRVVRAVLHAARRARDMIDSEESEELATVVLELSDDPVDRADALLLLADAAQVRGDRDAVERHVAEAVELARASDTPAVLVRTVHVLAGHHMRGSNAELVALAERAYERVKADGTPVELVEAAWALCRECRYDDPAALIGVADEALAVARGLPTNGPLLQALHARIIVGQAALEDVDRVIGWCDEGVELARRERNPMMLALHQGAFVHSLMQRGRFADAQVVQAELDHAADVSNSPMFRWNTDVRGASFLLVQDRLDEAAAAIEAAGVLGATMGDARPAEEYAAQVGILHLVRDRFADLRPLLEAQAAEHPVGIWQWALALSEAHGGDIEAARARYATIELPAPAAGPPHWLWLPELATAAEVAMRCADEQLGREVVERIAPYRHLHAVFGVTLSLGSMERPLAFALTAAGDMAAAELALAAARRSNADAGLPLWVRMCGIDRLSPMRRPS